MKLCRFSTVDSGSQVAFNPEVVTRIQELVSKRACLIYTKDGLQMLQVQGNFETVAAAVEEASQEEKEEETP